MATKNFWLISVQDTELTVCLVEAWDKTYIVKSTGETSSWPTSISNAFVEAIDQSLASAAKKVSLPSQLEPSSAAFILPPFWVSSDGKITPPKLELVESACKKLKFQPLGFIANDEAIAEAGNLEEGFPVSFILLHLNCSNANLSLVYMGKVKERLFRNFSGTFHPAILESMLVEIKNDAALPPQIIVFGSYHPDIISALNSYPWVSQKNPETFLHLPEIKTYDQGQILNIYTQIIASQIEPDSIPSIQTDSAEEALSPLAEDEIQEVDATDLGFGDSLPDIDLTPSPPINTLPPPKLIELTPSPPPHHRLRIKLPRIHFPKLSLLPLFAAFPLLLLIPFLFSSSDLTIFVTPYSFEKKLDITLDAEANTIDPVRSVIPIQKNEFKITSSLSLPTTGSQTIGQKAKGKIKIYNKQAQTQQLEKDTVLTDPSGKKFLLVNPVQVASSSSDLEQGIITLGQTVAVAVAQDIGPEYNLSADTQLSFSQISSDLIIAKTIENFAGGTRQQVSAVSQEDQQKLKQEINQLISDSIDQEIDQKTKQLGEIIKQTSQSTQSRIDYSREIGEQADEITASVDTSVIVFSLKPEQKKAIITAFLAPEENFTDNQIDLDTFSLNFDIKQKSPNSASGGLTIKGQTLPSIDLGKLKKQIRGKSQKTMAQLIQDIPRAYNYNLKSNFSFLGTLNPLPFRVENITVTIKTETP